MTLGPYHSIMINQCRILHRFKFRQNAPLGDLFIFYIFLQFKLPKHRLKLRENAQLSDLVFTSISNKLCKDAAKTVEAAKYPLQRRQLLIPCHNMIKIMHSKNVLYVYNWLYVYLENVSFIIVFYRYDRSYI